MCVSTKCFPYSSHMFCLFYCFIQLWAGRKTAIMSIPVPQFPLLVLIFYYIMYYM